MELGLAGKRVVLTGGSKGIGKAIALAFAKQGANLSICARGEADLTTTQEELRELGMEEAALLTSPLWRDLSLTHHLPMARLKRR